MIERNNYFSPECHGSQQGLWKDNTELDGDRDIFLSYYWLMFQHFPVRKFEISAKTILACSLLNTHTYMHITLMCLC